MERYIANKIKRAMAMIAMTAEPSDFDIRFYKTNEGYSCRISSACDEFKGAWKFRGETKKQIVQEIFHKLRGELFKAHKEYSTFFKLANRKMYDIQDFMERTYNIEMEANWK